MKKQEKLNKLKLSKHKIAKLNLYSIRGGETNNCITTNQCTVGCGGDGTDFTSFGCDDTFGDDNSIDQ